MKRRAFIRTGFATGLGAMFLPSAYANTLARRTSNGIRAGAAQAVITPPLNVPLDGAIMQIGAATHVHDELFARCLVLDDGSTKLAFAIVDNTMISDVIHEKTKELVEKHTGIPRNNVLIAATHTHSTPRAVVGLKPDSVEHRNYLLDLPVRISDGIRRAANNLAPAMVGWGSAEDPRHVFNRRWHLREGEVLVNPFGDSTERVFMNPPREKIERPSGPVDPEVFVLAVRHRDGRPMAVLANYGLHYVGGVPDGVISSDYFGEFAEQLKRRLGAEYLDPPFVGIMSNGTSGDVTANDLSRPPEVFPPFERMRMIAGHLTDTVLKVYAGLTWHEHVPLSSVSTTLSLAVRKPDQNRLAWARSVPAPPGTGRLTRQQIYAREALALDKYPARVTITLQAFRIGSLAVAAIPNEVFAATGLAIKKGSPFSGSTFTIELANGYHGYLPTAEQHRLGGYETWPARSAYLEVGAEEAIRNGVLELIGKLK